MRFLDFIFDEMMAHTADLSNRTSIVISDSCYSRPHGYEDENYLRWLNFQYEEKQKIVIPYHYAITNNGIKYCIKSDFLSSEFPEIPGYENDIFILSEQNLLKMNTTQKESLVSVISMVCQKHLLDIDAIVFEPYNSQNDSGILNVREEIVNMVAEKLEKINTDYIVKHDFMREQEKTGLLDGSLISMKLDRDLSLQELSDYTGIPISVLKLQNPGLTE